MTTVTNKNGIEFDIDAIATDLNGKADRDLVNCTNPIVSAPYVTSRVSVEGGGIVEIWSDGYCVQTGSIGQSTTGGYPTYTITLTQPYKDANYQVFVTGKYPGATNNGTNYCSARTTTSITIISVGYGSDWRTEGYIR